MSSYVFSQLVQVARYDNLMDVFYDRTMRVMQIEEAMVEGYSLTEEGQLLLRQSIEEAALASGEMERRMSMIHGHDYGQVIASNGI